MQISAHLDAISLFSAISVQDLGWASVTFYKPRLVVQNEQGPICHLADNGGLLEDGWPIRNRRQTAAGPLSYSKVLRF